MASVARPGSAATSSQSARPCVPSVAGRRQIVFAPPRAATCASSSRRKSTTDSSRKRFTSGVGSPGTGPPKRSAQRSQRQRPARRVVDADMRRNDPRGLVPEDRVDAALEHPVGPLLAEVAVGGAVEAGGGDAAPVVEHLALLGMEGDPAALGLAAEGAAEPPRARLDEEALGVRGGDDLGHRVAVVGEVVLGERVEHARVAARREVGHVPAHVARDPDAEVRAACAEWS